MLADPPSRNRQLAAFRKSDGITNLALPQSGTLPMIAGSIELAMRSEKTVEVRRACSDFLIEAAKFYRVPSCKVRVLAARPLRVRELWTTELFGDYDPCHTADSPVDADGDS